MIEVMEKVNQFISGAKRVLVISRKPTMTEYTTMAKVTGLGILVISILAYLVYLFFAFTGL